MNETSSCSGFPIPLAFVRICSLLRALSTQHKNSVFQQFTRIFFFSSPSRTKIYVGIGRDDYHPDRRRVVDYWGNRHYCHLLWHQGFTCSSLHPHFPVCLILPLEIFRCCGSVTNINLRQTLFSFLASLVCLLGYSVVLSEHLTEQRPCLAVVFWIALGIVCIPSIRRCTLIFRRAISCCLYPSASTLLCL